VPRRRVGLRHRETAHGRAGFKPALRADGDDTSGTHRTEDSRGRFRDRRRTRTILDNVSPSIAHYSMNREAFARKAVPHGLAVRDRGKPVKRTALRLWGSSRMGKSLAEPIRKQPLFQSFFFTYFMNSSNTFGRSVKGFFSNGVFSSNGLHLDKADFCFYIIFRQVLDQA